MVFFNLQLFLTSWWTLFYIDYVSHVRIILPCNGQNLLEEVRQKTDDLVEQSEPVGEVWGPTWPRWPSGPCSKMRSGPRRRGKRGRSSWRWSRWSSGEWARDPLQSCETWRTRRCFSVPEVAGEAELTHCSTLFLVLFSGKNINFSFLSYNRQKVDKWQLFFSSFTLIVVSWRMSKVLT